VSGYSGTPLAKKLGIKAGFRIKTFKPPSNYAALLAPLPEDVTIASTARPPVDLWHLFVRSRKELVAKLPQCREEIKPDGMIWVSWPKKTSGVITDMAEDVVREVAFPLQLVDVKVCAVDETWSGLKLVIRREQRAKPVRARVARRI
jgi:hypothetical protein